MRTLGLRLSGGALEVLDEVVAQAREKDPALTRERWCYIFLREATRPVAKTEMSLRVRGKATVGLPGHTTELLASEVGPAPPLETEPDPTLEIPLPDFLARHLELGAEMSRVMNEKAKAPIEWTSPAGWARALVEARLMDAGEHLRNEQLNREDPNPPAPPKAASLEEARALRRKELEETAPTE